MSLFWLWLAAGLYWMVVLAVNEAFKPRPLPDPDWFYQGGTWTRSDQPGIVHGQYESFNPEPSVPPESKPRFWAG